MTESSFPLVGADFTSDEFSQTLLGLGNGVLDDWGSPYAITLNTNDTATIAVSTTSGVARAVVAGFGHRLTASVTLSIPPVASTTSYTIGLLYDPGQAGTPVLLTVKTGTVALTTGQVWLPLHVIVRQASQALTSAVLSSPMVYVMPRARAVSQAALQAQNPNTYLRGTSVYCGDTGAALRADLVGSTPTWVPAGPLVGQSQFSTQILLAGSPTWTDLITITVTTPAASCMADWSAIYSNANSGLNRTVDFRVTCDGTQIGPILSYDAPLTPGATGYGASFQASSAVVAGSHTWKLQGRASVASACYAKFGTMKITED